MIPKQANARELGEPLAFHKRTAGMKAVQLTALRGLDSLRVADVDLPVPQPGEVLIKVMAAGINYAELEQTRGAYPFQRPLPGVMGFEAAGEVVELGPGVENLRIGDRIASLASSGGYAEYATARADLAIPIPENISFAQATSIVVQGVSAFALLKLAARPRPNETILIQAAAGGVGLYLVQLAKLMGAGRVVALAGSQRKVDLVRDLGADVAIDYSRDDWQQRVRDATDGKGIDVVLEMASGDIGKASFELLAPFGRIVVFGAKNVGDTIYPEQVAQLIRNNQTLIGFNVPALNPDDVAECIPDLLRLIAEGKLRLFAETVYALADVRKAFEAIASRSTIGKVVLVP